MAITEGGHPATTVEINAVARCRELLAQIDESASLTGAYAIDGTWTNGAGAPVYGTHPVLRDVDERFLAEIPERAFFFTGWPPEDVPLNALGRAIWHAATIVGPARSALWLQSLGRHVRAGRRPSGTLPSGVVESLSAWRVERLPRRWRTAAACDGTSLDRLALAERLGALHALGCLQRLEHAASPLIVEIGAGYGLLARAILDALPAATYVIVDLPSSLALSGCYLASRQRRPVRLHSTGAPTRGAVSLVLNTALESIEGRPISLAINTLSFAEMPVSTVKSYAAFIARNLAPEGELFEQNFDNSHFGRPNHCDPFPALATELRLARELRGPYLKGRPRLWRVSHSIPRSG